MANPNAPPIPLRGLRGALKWYYQTAAGITNYSVTYSPERQAWTMRGGLVAPNAYSLEQRPLLFVAYLKDGAELTWPVVEFSTGRAHPGAIRRAAQGLNV